MLVLPVPTSVQLGDRPSQTIAPSRTRWRGLLKANATFGAVAGPQVERVAGAVQPCALAPGAVATSSAIVRMRALAAGTRSERVRIGETLAGPAATLGGWS